MQSFHLKPSHVNKKVKIKNINKFQQKKNTTAPYI